jgi:hypothetical protein
MFNYEGEIVEVVKPEQSVQCPPEHTSHPTGNECLIDPLH